jgi:anaerobic magnesium-protoporphyrin IX monomethyl ester cyclase
MTEIILFQPRCGKWDIMGYRAPTGLLNVAAVPVDRGYDLVLLDQRICRDWKEELKNHLKDAKIFGITVMAGQQIEYSSEVLAYVKKIKPEIMTVVGGTWAQTSPELCIQEKNTDVVCSGEGDYLIPELMDVLDKKKKNKTLKKVLGIYYKEKGKIKQNPRRPLIRDMDALPKIPWNLINMGEYTAVGFEKGKKSISLILSRGCPYRCTFCSVSRFSERVWRSYSVERALEDLEILEKEYGITDFYFNDDNMAGSPKFFSEFAKKLAESGKKYNWGTAGIRADTILRLSEETLSNLVKCGCKNLDVGVESGNPRVLEFVQKDEPLKIIREANKKLSKYPLIIKYSFMGGFPTETKEEFFDTVKFKRLLEKENPYAVGIMFLYTPFPQTEMYDYVIERGFKPPKHPDEWANFNYDTWYKIYPSWLSKEMIKIVEGAVFLSYFDNKNIAYKYPNPIMQLAFRLYHPIAKFRSENNLYGFFIEKKLANLFSDLNEKYDLVGKLKSKKKN